MTRNYQIIKLKLAGNVYYSLHTNSKLNFLELDDKSAPDTNLVTINFLRDKLKMSCEEIYELTKLKGVKLIDTDSDSYIVAKCPAHIGLFRKELLK